MSAEIPFMAFPHKIDRLIVDGDDMYLLVLLGENGIGRLSYCGELALPELEPVGSNETLQY